jgi:hypothetical protein
MLVITVPYHDPPFPFLCPIHFAIIVFHSHRHTCTHAPHTYLGEHPAHTWAYPVLSDQQQADLTRSDQEQRCGICDAPRSTARQFHYHSIWDEQSVLRRWLESPIKSEELLFGFRRARDNDWQSVMPTSEFADSPRFIEFKVQGCAQPRELKVQLYGMCNCERRDGRGRRRRTRRRSKLWS